MIHQLSSTRFVDCGEGGEVAPFQPHAFCGCGTSLYFHRPVAPGVYQAEAWLTFFYLPLWPLAAWVILPRRMRTREGDGISAETYEFEFLGRRPVTWARLLGMLNRAVGRVNAVLGPLAVSYLYAIRTDGGGPNELKGILLLGSFAWGGGLCLFWSFRRDRIYERAEAGD